MRKAFGMCAMPEGSHILRNKFSCCWRQHGGQTSAMSWSMGGQNIQIIQVNFELTATPETVHKSVFQFDVTTTALSHFSKSSDSCAIVHPNWLDSKIVHSECVEIRCNATSVSSHFG